MSADDNKELNLRWVQAWNARDWATEAACRTSDFVVHLSGVAVPLDADGWGGFTHSVLIGFPDAQITVDDSVEAGNLVASRWTIIGTHRGAFQGVPETGRAVTLPGVDFSRVVDGRIAEHWAQFDLLLVLQQIGALPAPA